MWFRKTSARRQAIREDVAEAESLVIPPRRQTSHTFLIAAVFLLGAIAIQFWPKDPLPYHTGELARSDLRSPVGFQVKDADQTEMLRNATRDTSPSVLVADIGAFDRIYGQLNHLKYDVQSARNLSEVPAEVRARFPGLTEEALKSLQSDNANVLETDVRSLVYQVLPNVPFLSSADYAAISERQSRQVSLTTTGQLSDGMEQRPTRAVLPLGAMTDAQSEDLGKIIGDRLSLGLKGTVLSYFAHLELPTYRYDRRLTTKLAEEAAAAMKPFGRDIKANEVIVARGEIVSAQQMDMLRAANDSYEAGIVAANPWAPWLSALGRSLIVLILTGAGTLYVVRMTGIAKSAKHGWAVCALLLLTLVTARVVVSYAPMTVYLMGMAPTLLTAIILVIAYNQRFALGMAGLHGLLVTMTLRQGIDFYLPMLAGAAAFCFAINEIRTRGRLIEIGMISSAVIFVAIWALGLARMLGTLWSPWIVTTDMHALATDSIWAATSGILVSMFALAILPTVERVFQITTAMTLLELCDANKPLLQRLSQEAPGTFNHSLTVGIMAEAAGNAIGANGLLCRVGAYYHDVGKLSKPQYFIENQTSGGPNRHEKLSPAMSLLIIVGHVKDGIELAREYALPLVVHQFIGQHHGTTLVEYFYHAAKKRQEREGDDMPEVSETEFRYPGPRPQTREAAIVMICDACESVVRSIDEPTPGRVESAVHSMIMKRLMDGQFAECDLTLRDLSEIEDRLIRTLAGIHHGRVAYPSNKPAALSLPA